MLHKSCAVWAPEKDGLCKLAMLCESDQMWPSAVSGAVFIVQILAMGYFAGGQRGLNLPLGAVSMNAYSYKGLVSNELRGGRTWGCPQQSYLPLTYTQVFCATVAA